MAKRTWKQMVIFYIISFVIAIILDALGLIDNIYFAWGFVIVFIIKDIYDCYTISKKEGSKGHPFIEHAPISAYIALTYYGSQGFSLLVILAGIDAIVDFVQDLLGLKK